MIRAYKIINNTLVPVDYDSNIRAVYVSSELFAQLYAASVSFPEKLKEAERIFENRLNTACYQVVCLTGDDWKQSIEEYSNTIPQMDVPINMIYKVGG